MHDPAANHPQPKRVINEWVESCQTEQGLRKSSTNYTCDVSPGARAHTEFKEEGTYHGEKSNEFMRVGAGT